MSRSFRAVLCALLCVAVPGRMVAASPKVDALGKFEEGAREFTAGHYEQALAAFRLSMELEPSPNTRFKIAKCFQALGRIGSAYKNFRRAADEAQDRVNATGDPRYGATREAALVAAAALDKDVPRLVIAAPAEPPKELLVTIDGELVPPGMFETPLEVDPGDRLLVATGPRLQRFERRFTIPLGGKERIERTLAKMRTALLQLELQNRPIGMALAVDDQPLAPEVFERPMYLNPGEHRVSANAPGYLPFLLVRQLKNDEEVRVPVFLKLPQDPKKIAFFVTGGATLVALAVGIGVGSAALQADSAQQQITPLLRDPAVRDQIRTQAIIADSAFAFAGALAGTTLILGLVSRWRDGPQAPRKVAWLLPWLTPGSSAGLSCHLEY